ncbi:MAG: U32 family peptidase [Pseudomonadota bacterium]
MKILSPCSSKEEVVPLIQAGANELYCGVVPSEWSDKYGMFDTLNRREGYGANFSNFGDLREAVALAHGKGVPAFVTMNGLYTQDQIPLVLELNQALKNIRVDGLIIADIALLLLLQKERHFEHIHVGTGGTTFNSKTADFYRANGASRIILPRHLTVSEIQDLTQGCKSDVEFEVFVLNTLCQNIDGFCTFYHGLPFLDKEIAPKMDQTNVRFFHSHDLDYKGHGCHLNFSKKVFDAQGKDVPGRLGEETTRHFGKRCGACALFDLQNTNIASLKIVERSAPTKDKICDTKFMKGVLGLLEKGLSKEQFVAQTQDLYCNTYNYETCSGFTCYYPSVFAAPT